MPLCALWESGAWLYWNRILRKGPGEVYRRSWWAHLMSQATAHDQTAWYVSWSCAATAAPSGALREPLTWCKDTHTGRAGAAVLPWRCDLLSHLTLVIAGTLEWRWGIWTMLGRWLLVPVLDFKLDLQRKKPCAESVMPARVITAVLRGWWKGLEKKTERKRSSHFITPPPLLLLFMLGNVCLSSENTSSSVKAHRKINNKKRRHLPLFRKKVVMS